MNWKTIRSETVLKDRWISVRADDCLMPNGTVIKPYYLLEYPDFVNALALTTDNQVLLNREYRHGTKTTKLELPSGTVDAHETPLEAIRRELLEETGYVFDEIIFTGKTSPNPANHTNFAHSFLAIGGHKTADQRLDISEMIENVLVPLEVFLEMLENNQLDNAMHIASAFYGLKKWKEINAVQR